MTKNISSNSHLLMVGENAKMLYEQIEEEKGKLRSERLLLADEETEISFWTPTKMKGLELTDIQIFVATQRLGRALLVAAMILQRPKVEKARRILKDSDSCRI
jgi:hypothetical protein